ncbi:nucleotide-diphospho-sugar transferase [Ceraceosorus guamensis]|uniref:Nucleotide-diphospho-sugar transferase n=1 Tax=Ceraceosorus guamensis TaxID=1522189 RepID=A0A316VW52_9BASI|nr:nucleotide-diphospho-sugar transferase [Ceraceosorus guamensis]PWN39675.1 nucleotide-diphospho-sugar transferase [Ceraceosorus guamensis]
MRTQIGPDITSHHITSHHPFLTDSDLIPTPTLTGLSPHSMSIPTPTPTPTPTPHTSSSSPSASGGTTPFAIVTLVTTDDYLPGALALSASLAKHLPASTDQASRSASDDASATTSDAPRQDIHTIALVTPASLSPRTIKSLARRFDRIVGVEQISLATSIVDEATKKLAATGSGVGGAQQRSQDAKLGRRIRRQAARNLALLGRPDLGESAGAALTKLHAFRMDAYKRVLFLDADTIVLRPIHHLFGLAPSPLYAAPDIGWPDAFNSGVLLLQPSASTFASIRSFAATTGTWDGADQGLLNDFFGGERKRGQEGSGGGWDRLSFTYNATPNGGYTYAPAYVRYGSGIHIAHFIGSHKPWHSPRPNADAAAAGRDRAANDYTALLRSWHNYYEAAVPSRKTLQTASGSRRGATRVVHSSRGVEIVEEEEEGQFEVPTYQAAWERSETGVAASSGAGNVDDLRAMFGEGRTSVGDIASRYAAVGAYYSLPLEGRTSLIPPPADAWDDPGDSTDEEAEARKRKVAADAHRAREAAEMASSGQAVKPQHASSTSPTGDGTWSPPHLSWNPAMGPPPSDSYQMAAPPDAYYENAWESNDGSRHAFFRPAADDRARADEASRRRALERLQREHWFDNLGSDRPDPNAVKAVFPWEQGKQTGESVPTRRFPEEPPSVQPHSSEMDRSLAAAASQPPSLRNWPDQVSSSSQPASYGGNESRGLPQTLSYTNAWDVEGSLGRFGADRWRPSMDEGQSRGVQTEADVVTRGSQTKRGRYKHWSGGTGGSSVQADGSIEDIRRDEGAKDSALGMYGVGAHQLADQSADGDDESSSEGNESDDEEGYLQRQHQQQPQQSRPTSLVGRGYQRKAEASANVAKNASPRSPKTPVAMLSPLGGSATSGSGGGGGGGGGGALGGSGNLRYGSFDLRRTRSDSAEDSSSTPTAASPEAMGSAAARATMTGRARIRPDGTYDDSAASPPSSSSSSFSFHGSFQDPSNTLRDLTLQQPSLSARAATATTAATTTTTRQAGGHASRAEAASSGSSQSGGGGAASPSMGTSPVFSRSELTQLARTHQHASSSAFASLPAAGRRRGGAGNGSTGGAGW